MDILIGLMLLIINIIIGISIYSLRNYFRKKAENFATKEDIRKISSEEQTGKLEAEARKKTMAAVTKAVTKFENLSLKICLDGVDKKNTFNPSNFRKEMFDIWSELIGSLDENVIILPRHFQEEVSCFRDKWPHLLGIGEIKWVGDILVTVFIKIAAIKVLRTRIQKYLEVSQSAQLNLNEAEGNYDINKLVEHAPQMRKNVAVEMMLYGVSKKEIEEMFPGIEIEISKSKPVS